jgi:hypothetical protein
MLRWLRAKTSVEDLAVQLMPPVVARWLESFDAARLELPPTTSVQFRAKREWVLMEMCAWIAGGLAALGDAEESHSLLSATREKATEFLLAEQLFASSDEVKRLFTVRLPVYGSGSPQEVGKAFENFLDLEPDLLRRMAVSGTFFPSVLATRELFTEVKKSARW